MAPAVTLLLGVAALAAAAAASPLETLPWEVQQGLVRGRSGQCVRYDARARPPDSVAALLEPDAAANGDATSPSASAVSLHDVASFATRAVGVAPPRAPRASDPWSRRLAATQQPANANLLLVVEGLGGASLERLPQLAQLFGQRASLTDHAYPRNQLATLVSVATGAPRHAHGIVGESWRDAFGEHVRAFEAGREDATSRVSGVADAVLAGYGGESLVVALSSAPQAAAAVDVHPSVAAHFAGASARRWTLHGDALGPVSTRALRDALGSRDSLWSALSSLRVRLDAARDAVEVSRAAGDGSGEQEAQRFSLRDASDAALFLELQAAASLADARAHGDDARRLADSVPDHFAVVLAGLSALRRARASAAKLRMAEELVSAAVPLLLQRLRGGVRGGRVAAEVVLLGEPEHFNPEDEIYAQPGERVACVERAAKQESDGALLLSLAELHAQTRFRVQSGSNKPPTNDQIRMYQIVLWLSIALAFTLLATIAAFCCMDLRRDSLLYGKINPNWHHRKHI